MPNRLRPFLQRLGSHSGGNAALIVAIGMPVLVGGAGLAVDTAQWYMWKRELQFAADQAALAGAWARTDTTTQSSYQTRAIQEFGANLQLTSAFAANPDVALEDFDGGTQNSIAVTATATRRLPFSSFVTGRATTVRVTARATFGQEDSQTACLIALDPHDSGAITIGGNASLSAACGIASLSDSATSIRANGNPTVNSEWIAAAGGIESWYEENTEAEIHANMSGLEDPFADTAPPTNDTPRSDSCTAGGTTTTATVTVTISTGYSYYKGSNQNNAAPYNYPTPKQGSAGTPSVQSGQSVPNGTSAGTSSSSNATWTKLSGNGQNTIWEVATVTTTTTYSNVVATTTPTQASLQPGTYSDIDVSCTTNLSPGVYVIDGGRFKVTGQHQVTGSGVLFVLKNGAYFDLAGGSDINLTGMSQDQFEALGYSSSAAAKMDGMLIFEDRNSSGTKNKNKMNGNSNTVLNGTIYLPNSDIKINGTAAVTSQCLLIAAKNITIQGTADFSTFCPPGMDEDSVVAHSVATVKLSA